MAHTSFGYKRLTGRRISLLFINSTTILNLHFCVSTTPSSITKTSLTFITAAPLTKLLIFSIPYPAKIYLFKVNNRSTRKRC